MTHDVLTPSGGNFVPVDLTIMTDMSRRTIVVGDVHGCLEELDGLLRAVQFARGRDRLVFVGDLIDRGPDPVGVIRRARELGAESVMGNHEDKCVQWFRRDALCVASGKPNNMMVHPDRLAEWFLLSREDLDWIRGLPVTISLPEGWLIVHAGFEDLPMGEQRPDKMMRVCNIDPVTGKMKSPMDDMEQRPGTIPWMDRWRRPESVVYGHAVHGTEAPRVDRSSAGSVCVGIDTGCVFGGHLTAMVLTDGPMEFARVKARAAYVIRKGVSP